MNYYSQCLQVRKIIVSWSISVTQQANANVME